MAAKKPAPLRGRERRLAEKAARSAANPEAPTHTASPLRSSVEGLVALRIEGTTFLVTPSSAEDFRARYAGQAKKGD